MLAKNATTEKAQKLVMRLDETVGAMTGMLNALLDINQIESGTVVTERTTFPIDELLQRMQGEFAFHAQAQNLELHVVPCSLSINTDPLLLEQMIRNLLSNALKYTKTGKVLLGCRRRKNSVSIEIWDTVLVFTSKNSKRSLTSITNSIIAPVSAAEAWALDCRS